MTTPAQAIIIALLFGINLIFSAPVFARFASQQTRQVPIARLLKNLESQRNDAVGKTDKALVDFRIGRLHAMAYALKIEEAPCKSEALPNSRFELPDFGYTPDHVQFRVKESKGQNNDLQAREHLKNAIKSLEAALKTDPDLLIAKLGLAWCLEQSGQKEKAKNLYRQVFADAYENEKNSKGGMYNWSITLETASYLKPLLDPKKERSELERVESKSAEIEKLPRYITPIMVPIAKSNMLEDLIIDKEVIFDLDGFGPRRYGQWLSPKAAWLVYDGDGKGNIDSGLQLIGQSSFWIFWQNGYEVLKGLDDNKDGKLTEKELSGLSLWQDANCNAKCESGEVKALSEYGIIALSTTAALDKSRLLWNERGVSLAGGSFRPSYDLILPTIEKPKTLGAEKDSEHHHTAAYHKSFENAKHWHKTFDDPERDIWQEPEKVIERLGIHDNDTVADIGAGTGYFAIRIAKSFPNVKVIAADIEDDMIVFLKLQSHKRQLHNLQAFKIDAAKPSLPAKANLVLIVNTLHHIDDRVAYLSHLKNSMAQNGRVALIDFTIDSPLGPPKKHRIPKNEAIREFESAGFKLENEAEILQNQYFLMFTAN